MSLYPASFERLTDCLRRLPGIGAKSAQRMAFWFLSLSDAEAEDFAAAIVDAKHSLHRCAVCQNLTDERSREYDGVYHVLHGVISPLRHVGPDDLTIKELLSRLDGSVEEVIMATNPDAEGEATAMYLSRLVKPLGVRVTRIAYGIPVGANLEFADDATLFRALEGRREI